MTRSLTRNRRSDVTPTGGYSPLLGGTPHPFTHPYTTHPPTGGTGGRGTGGGLFYFALAHEATLLGGGGVPTEISPGQILSHIKVGVRVSLASRVGYKGVGVLYCSMEGNTTTTVTFESNPCPDCGESTGLVHLGGEPPREVCGRFGCNWEGESLL